MIIEEYIRLLDKWRHVTNLISGEGFRELRSQHIPNALQIHELFPEKLLWLDIGSGAGLPGVIISAMLQAKAGAQVHCVEADGRKCAFLREVSIRLTLPMKVHQARIQDIAPNALGGIEVVTARAFASLPPIIRIADPFLRQGAVAVLPRGLDAVTDTALIDEKCYEVASVPSRGYKNGAIVIVRRRAEARNVDI